MRESCRDPTLFPGSLSCQRPKQETLGTRLRPPSNKCPPPFPSPLPSLPPYGFGRVVRHQNMTVFKFENKLQVLTVPRFKLNDQLFMSLNSFKLNTCLVNKYLVSFSPLFSVHLIRYQLTGFLKFYSKTIFFSFYKDRLLHPKKIFNPLKVVTEKGCLIRT